MDIIWPVLSQPQPTWKIGPKACLLRLIQTETLNLKDDLKRRRMKTIIKISVRGYHIDYFNHINHGRYIEFLEEARWHYLEENSLMDPIHADGGIHVVARIDIQYMAPAGVGDVLYVETGVVSRTEKSFTMRQIIAQDYSGQCVATADVTNVFVNEKGRSCPVSEVILEVWPDLASAQKII